MYTGSRNSPFAFINYLCALLAFARMQLEKMSSQLIVRPKTYSVDVLTRSNIQQIVNMLQPFYAEMNVTLPSESTLPSQVVLEISQHVQLIETYNRTILGPFLSDLAYIASIVTNYSSIENLIANAKRNAVPGVVTIATGCQDRYIKWKQLFNENLAMYARLVNYQDEVKGALKNAIVRGRLLMNELAPNNYVYSNLDGNYASDVRIRWAINFQIADVDAPTAAANLVGVFGATGGPGAHYEGMFLSKPSSYRAITQSWAQRALNPALVTVNESTSSGGYILYLDTIPNGTPAVIAWRWTAGRANNNNQVQTGLVTMRFSFTLGGPQQNGGAPGPFGGATRLDLFIKNETTGATYPVFATVSTNYGVEVDTLEALCKFPVSANQDISVYVGGLCAAAQTFGLWWEIIDIESIHSPDQNTLVTYIDINDRVQVVPQTASYAMVFGIAKSTPSPMSLSLLDS